MLTIGSYIGNVKLSCTVLRFTRTWLRNTGPSTFHLPSREWWKLPQFMLKGPLTVKDRQVHTLSDVINSFDYMFVSIRSWLNLVLEVELNHKFLYFSLVRKSMTDT